MKASVSAVFRNAGCRQSAALTSVEPQFATARQRIGPCRQFRMYSYAGKEDLCRTLLEPRVSRTASGPCRQISISEITQSFVDNGLWTPHNYETESQLHAPWHSSNEFLMSFEKKSADPVICHCLGITESEIRSAGQFGGCRTIADVKVMTAAGSGCTCCHPHIITLLQNSCSHAEMEPACMMQQLSDSTSKTVNGVLDSAGT